MEKGTPPTPKERPVPEIPRLADYIGTPPPTLILVAKPRPVERVKLPTNLGKGRKVNVASTMLPALLKVRVALSSPKSTKSRAISFLIVIGSSKTGSPIALPKPILKFSPLEKEQLNSVPRPLSGLVLGTSLEVEQPTLKSLPVRVREQRSRLYKDVLSVALSTTLPQQLLALRKCKIVPNPAVLTGNLTPPGKSLFSLMFLEKTPISDIP